MALASGTRLGDYEILTLLGAGGMGEVYRAKDTKLGRDVALKILPASFTTDPERVARFHREAQVLASLNHPHIAQIHGLDDADGTQFLVLELVDGESLDKRIARGRMPVDEALGIAKQIAEALEAAHEKGIIHRDLKPANIALTKNGQVKVLDFGLAKAVETTGGSVELTNSPTITSHAMMTRVGMVLGTAAYMAPEQTKGNPADKLSDIWAFGCVLYEMLVGTRPFVADDVTSTMAAILERAPSWTDVPPATPLPITRLLERCLQKSPRRRLHDIADARIELEDVLSGAASTTGQPAASVAARPHYVVAAAAAIAGAAVVAAIWLMLRPVIVPAAIARLQIVLPEPMESSGGVLAVSPDGRRIVYSTGSAGRDQLFIRDLDQFESKPVVGSEHAVTATFSPDGQWIAFVADRKVKKVAVSGGTPRTVHETVDEPGLNWTADQSILFNPGTATGIWRVSADGGEASALTMTGARDNMHRFPELLPNGKGVLYAAQGGVSDDQVFVQSLESHQSRLIAKGTAPHYLQSGHVVYVDSGTLYAVRFDQERMEAIGSPKAVIEGIRQTSSGVSLIGVSRSGSALAYVAAGAGPRNNELVWVDHDGNEQTTGAAGKPYAQPRLSPDGRYVVTSLRGDAEDLWLYDLARGASSRLTAKGSSSFPVWSPDGRRLALSVGRNDIIVRALDGSTADRRIVTGDIPNYPFSWSPDSRTIAYVAVQPRTLQDVWAVTVDGGKTQPVLTSPFREGAPVFSPDGHWIAYVSDESGRNEIYVSPFPGPGEKAAVSTDGGSEPVWARTSATLFYRTGDAMMAVDVTTSPALTVSRARVLFKKPYERSIALWPNYDVTSDGRRLLMVKGNDAERSSAYVNVVVNWIEELRGS